MYLQITTKCNMACDHCCFKCKPGKGEHMELQTFKQAISFIEDYDEHITIGGGEPTIHPHFNSLLLECVAASEGAPFIVTNGTITKTALLLHKLSKAKVINAHLSTDIYHNDDMVDEKVFNAFGCEDWDCDRGFHGPNLTGRWAEENGEAPSECACNTKLIQPDGQIRLCGCLDAPIVGDVWQGITKEWAWDYECHLEMNETE